jgi:hypothetical protein
MLNPQKEARNYKEKGCGSCANRQQNCCFTVKAEVILQGESSTVLRVREPDHGTLVVACPAKLIWITPPHAHISLDWSSRAGMLLIKTVGAPGVHGAGVTGMQGIGVNTPRAAVVAVATVGFAIEEQVPKAEMFTMGA